MTKKFLLPLFVSLICLNGIDSKNLTAQTRHSKPTLESLRKYVGKYANDRVLKHPVVHRSLARLMGPDRLKLERYIIVAGPVDMVAGDIVASGCAPHDCIDKAAVVVVGLSKGEVHAAILENGEILIYSAEKIYAHLPEALTSWVAVTVDKSLKFDGTRVKVRNR